MTDVSVRTALRFFVGDARRFEWCEWLVRVITVSKGLVEVL